MSHSAQPPTAPNDVFALSHEFVDAFAALSPVRASFYGVAGHDHRWDDFSPAGVAARAALIDAYRARLDALPAPTDRWVEVAKRVMADYLQMEADYYAHGEPYLDLNNIDSTFQVLRQVFDVIDTTAERGWRDLVSRLEGIGVACEGYRATLEEGRRRERVVAKRQVRAVVEQARVSEGESSFFVSLPGAFEAAGSPGGPELRARLDAGVAGARRAFGALADYLEKTYLPSATESDAAGRDRYLRATRRFLGSTIDPLETYAWGWTQVREHEAAMARVAEEIRPGASVREVIELLSTDPARCAPDLEVFLTEMRARQQQALTDLDGTHFDIPDAIRRIEVKLAPRGGALGAYYMPPSEDLSRPGTVWYSQGDELTNIPRYGEVTTAYHEGFPGHHLQCGLQVLLADRLSRVQRLMVIYSGHAEGWALYAEQLMYELGYFERPDYVLGMHQAKLMRACRVVADIGMHLGLRIPETETFHPGEVWSYELGVALMNERAFMPIEYARSEVTRYLGWPGQAICYKVGERAILELRDELCVRKGAAFDLKDFHARVVGSGSVGLELMREIVLRD